MYGVRDKAARGVGSLSGVQVGEEQGRRRGGDRL